VWDLFITAAVAVWDVLIAGAAVVCDFMLNDVMIPLVSLYNVMPFEKWLILITGMWTSVWIGMTALDFSWPMFRRHGMAHWVLLFMFGVCGLLIIINLSSIVLSLFADISTLGATTILSALVLGLAATYVINEHRESATFKPKNLLP
jgi:hypothetical protein